MVLLLQCCPRFLLASSEGLSSGLGIEHRKLEPAELPLKGKLVVKRPRTNKFVYELFV